MSNKCDLDLNERVVGDMVVDERWGRVLDLIIVGEMIMFVTQNQMTYTQPSWEWCF